MADALVAIGGQGQHIALAYLVLSKIHGKTPKDIYIIDADALPDKGPITQTLSKAYKDKKKEEIGYIPPTPEPQGDANKNEFQNLFRTGTNKEQRVLDIIFTEEQKKISVVKGMYGSPSVGSTSFLSTIKQTMEVGKKGRKNFVDFSNAIGKAGLHNVVIVCSIFGGTGGGCAPALLLELEKGTTQAGQPYNVQVTLIALLPWFQILKPIKDNPDDPVVQDLEKEANYHSCFSFLCNTFKDSEKLRIIFLGPRDSWGRQGIESSGNVNQPLIPHYIHLVAASLTEKSFEKRDDDFREFKSGIYGYVVDEGEQPMVDEIQDWKPLKKMQGLGVLEFFGVKENMWNRFPWNKKITDTVKNL